MERAGLRESLAVIRGGSGDSCQTRYLYRDAWQLLARVYDWIPLSRVWPSPARHCQWKFTDMHNAAVGNAK